MGNEVPLATLGLCLLRHRRLYLPLPRSRPFSFALSFSFSLRLPLVLPASVRRAGGNRKIQFKSIK